MKHKDIFGQVKSNKLCRENWAIRTVFIIRPMLAPAKQGQKSKYSDFLNILQFSSFREYKTFFI